MPSACDHQWGPWHGIKTHFRICDSCGALEINTTRPKPEIRTQPAGLRRSSWAG